jgi:acyl-CoA reductase-like NAD-dependent aldehyde dehydrogenase
MTTQASYTMTIGGQAVSGATSFEVLNPATGQVIGSAPDCTPEQLDAAVAAARKAFPAWSATPIEKRREALLGIAGVLGGNVEELKRLLTSEQGKPHEGAMGDILGGAYWCQATSTLEIPEKVVEESAERHGITRHVPIGVVGAIAPWNFPIILAMFKVAPALLAGNTVVLKPSPFTPLTTLRMGELLRGVLPDGVLNIVTGGDSLGPWMTSHPGIDKISFTGSSATGRKVMASASETLKRVTLELGGNDAAIVLPDVDVAEVAEKLFWAAFGNSGQICIATKRMYVHKDIYEPLKTAIVDYAKTVKMGDGAEQGTQLGPINNKLQYERVLDLIADSKAKGYKFLMGGDVSPAPGYFVPITIIDNPPENSRIVQEEQFGPVLPLLSFDTLEEAIDRANASPYGLGASIWTADEAKALDISSRIAAGTVWINETQHLSPLGAFGGHKQSGLGSEGALEGLLEYTNTQTVYVKKPAVAAAQ